MGAWLVYTTRMNLPFKLTPEIVSEVASVKGLDTMSTLMEFIGATDRHIPLPLVAYVGLRCGVSNECVQVCIAALLHADMIGYRLHPTDEHDTTVFSTPKLREAMERNAVPTLPF
jgi:hypothetical protein